MINNSQTVKSLSQIRYQNCLMTVIEADTDSTVLCNGNKQVHIPMFEILLQNSQKYLADIYKMRILVRSCFKYVSNAEIDFLHLCHTTVLPYYISNLDLPLILCAYQSVGNILMLTLIMWKQELEKNSFFKLD